MIWKLACELVDNFGEQTLLALKENKDKNLKLEMVLALDEGHEERLREMKRSETRRFCRAVKRLVDLDLLGKVKNGFHIANLDKGKNLARILSDFQRKMTEDCFVVSVKAEPWYAYGDPMFPRIPVDGCECTEVNFEGPDQLFEHLVTEWTKWLKAMRARNETFHWLFSAFPSPLKKFLNFETQWATTGLEVLLQLHSLPSTTLDWEWMEVRPVVPIRFRRDPAVYYNREHKIYRTISGFGLTCDLPGWPRESRTGVLKDYFRKFQDYKYCKKLGDMLNQANWFVRKHSYLKDLSKNDADIQPFKIRYARFFPISYFTWGDIDNYYSSRMFEKW